MADLGVTQPVVDFWGPASNFGIPIAAVLDTQKDPEMYVHSPPLSPVSVERLSLVPPSPRAPGTTQTTD